jgi:hypothetical protein
VVGAPKPKERRKKQMNYTKPEVAVLGDAKALIETSHPQAKPSAPGDGTMTAGPAYDLDE